MSDKNIISLSLFKLILCFLFFLFCFPEVSTAKPNRVNMEAGRVGVFVDTTDIIVSQNSKFLLVGQEIVITVQACSNSNQISKVLIAGIVISLTEKGTATLTMMGGSVGKHRIPVQITLIDAKGKSLEKNYTVEYQVGQAFTMIDEGNLNLLYIGVDNPLYIYVPTGNDDNIAVTIKDGGGTISKSGDGLYIVRVSNPVDECTITVFVDNKITGSKIFRVVNLPGPEARVGNYPSGSRLSFADFRNSSELKVAIADFPFKVDYSVLGFDIKIFEGSIELRKLKSVGSHFPPDLKTSGSMLKPGSIIIIDDIIVEEPKGRKIKLPALVYFID